MVAVPCLSCRSPAPQGDSRQCGHSSNLRANPGQSALRTAPCPPERSGRSERGPRERPKTTVEQSFTTRIQSFPFETCNPRARGRLTAINEIVEEVLPNPAYEEIKRAGTLPSPTGTAVRILEIANRMDAGAAALAEVVESDPSTAARLLQLVNSPLAGQSRRVASVSRAVAFLGFETVKSVAIGFSLISQYRGGSCEAFDYEGFWLESVARAATARHVTNRLGNFAPDEAFTCGLLCQIGRLAFATVYSESYAAILSDADEDTLQLERTVYDIDHNELAAEMMSEWGVAEVFCEAVGLQDNLEAATPESSTRSLQLARTLRFGAPVSDVLVQGSADRKSLDDLMRKGRAIGIRPEAVESMFDSIREEWRSAADIFSLPARQVDSFAELYRHTLH